MRWAAVMIALLRALWSTVPPPAPRGARRRVRPFARFFVALDRVAPGLAPRAGKAFTRLIYETISLREVSTRGTFLNYGYAPPEDPDLPLGEEDEPDRYAIQLYHAVVGPVDLHGRDVLEVGSGRGGGSAFIKAYFGPRSMTGLDLAGRAIAFCERRYHTDGLRFVQGDAERLPFPLESFDVVVNVESSHGYPSVDRFLGEVYRVLRPGGHLLLADFRPSSAMDQLRQAFLSAGFTIVADAPITPHVVRALDLAAERSRYIIEHEVPRLLRGPAEEFMALEGSDQYQRFKSGQSEYARFVLLKE